ncbi:MAG: hypothetical protein UW24_C0031G0003 [Parcubacteria group bacterium GW2011_GWA2_44_12]|nr:MAG: hypothetical protein UW24_C0031G0003 [Parcubacteria group bacterium GW2011_GWA2_44_12]
MQNKLAFDHFVIFCLESACGVSDSSFLKSEADVPDPALEAVQEYFKKHRVNERGTRQADDDLKTFVQTYQIKEFYEKIYMADE